MTRTAVAANRQRADGLGTASERATHADKRGRYARILLRRLGHRRRLWALLSGGLVVYAVAFLAWAVAPFDVSPEVRDVIGDAAFLPPGILVAFLAWRAATVSGLSSQTRRAWLVLGVAYLAFWAGDVIYFWYDIIAREPPYPSLADAAYLVYYPLLLIGLISFPRVLGSGTERRRFGLDVTTVALGGAMVVWYFVLGPIAESNQTGFVETLVSVAYPVGDLILLLGLAVIVIRAPRELPHRALMFLLAALVAELAADLAYGVQNLNGTYEAGRAVDGLYMLGWALFGVGAYFGYGRPGPAERSNTRGTDTADRVPLVPYLAVALGYGLLVAAIRTSWSPTVAGLVVGAGGLTGLVVARQVIAVRENLRLVAQRESRRGEARFRSLVQDASDLIVVLDRSYAVQYQTPSVEHVLGYGLAELQGTRLVDLVHPDDVAAFEGFLSDTATAFALAAARETRLALKDGGWLYVKAAATNLLDDPDVEGIVVTVRNIDDRKRLELKLAHQAYHDPLTGLANRRLISEEVAKAVMRARAGRRKVVAVLFLGVDNLKTVNDSLGHQAGDQVLIEVAGRIQSAIRPDDLAGRVGGDEFAVLLKDPSPHAAAAALSERILGGLRQPFELDGVEIALGASIGIAVNEGGAELGDELIRNADCALYLAKLAGKGQSAFFRPGMAAPARERLDLEAALRHALERHEFELYFQPIVDLSTGRLAGAEALLRWHRPDHGLVSPAAFIPIAEETGLIVPLGAWVLEAACAAAQSWAPDADEQLGLPVAVNLSARQLREEGLVGQVADVLASTGLSPRRLVLEVTESVLIDDQAQTIRWLRGLKALGIGLAIDDFGTGYSSLSYLRTLPVDEIKIDRSFLGDLDRAAGAALVRGIVELGHSLGLTVAVEGVERREQADAVARFGCDRAQGFLLGRPMPVADFAVYLRSEPARGSQRPWDLLKDIVPRRRPRLGRPENQDRTPVSPGSHAQQKII